MSAVFRPEDQVFIVIGDVMLDKVTQGELKGIANEAPIPVFKQTSVHYSLGGAANVAANLAAMHCTVHSVGLVGADADADVLRALLTDKGISVGGIYIDKGRPTICKHRYYIHNRLVFRTDNESTEPAAPDVEAAVVAVVQGIVDSTAPGKVVKIVFSDYAKGTLTPYLRKSLIDFANARGLATFVDPKAALSQYAGCTFMKPNKAEAARLGGIRVDELGLAGAHAAIYEQTRCTFSLITLAEDGMSLGWKGAAGAIEHIHDKLEDSLEVIDVTGAGDVVLATVAYLWGFDIPYRRCLNIANRIAREAVMHCGTYVVSKVAVEILQGAFRDEQQLPAQPSIVFTNGCFDILHVGHLRLLKEARSFGDRLIVGLNSDASVRRLKGPTRPVNNQLARAEMLRTLPWVDEVIVFEEDTPAALIAEIKPDVLVKGGDYNPEQIVGREHAKEVRIIPFCDGYSTTRIITAALATFA
jgi:D-beta-D-heptose 7-phosphate kinase/D-beta-D-heptose 1-phosphate adenosyltransferase